MAHLACHGTLKPWRASLFRGNERLTLPYTVRSQVQLAIAELAFLSVWHAAEWTAPYMTDEALHLVTARCGAMEATGGYLPMRP